MEEIRFLRETKNTEEKCCSLRDGTARMPKNILIFSDGTGQAGGLRPDQRLSNIYKLYRATRTGPDSPIDPAKQVAFYETGLGSAELGGPAWTQPFTFARKLLSSGLGTGFTKNVADCYEAILKVYEPGDRVYLFGFSRGAYTARSVAGVMNLCGVPIKDKDGNPIPREGKAVREIADEAVHTVYEHGAGHARRMYEDEREELARRFRVKYGTEDDPARNERGNVAPYFIGVFDTVAALGASGMKRFGIIVAAALLAVLGLAIVSWLMTFLGFGFWDAALKSSIIAAGVIFIYSCHVRIKEIRDFPTKGKHNSHWSAWRFKHYDKFLDKRIRYARHAQAIDETRTSFERVGWGQRGDMKEAPADWLIQKWFAGNHSDIGGSYPETESRLSDIALKWMLEEATKIPNPILYDEAKLHLFPDPAAMQHSEVSSLRELYPRWFPKSWRRSWSEKPRPDIVLSACHESVKARFDLSGVHKHGVAQKYRPECLRNDPELKAYYETTTK